MAINIYNKGLEGIVKSTIDLSNDTLKVLLANSSYTFDANDEFVSDVSANEISDVSYGRVILSNTSFSLSGSSFVFDANNVTFSSLNGGVISHGIVYKEVTTDSDSVLVLHVAINDEDTTGQDFSIDFNDSGIFSITT